MTAPAEPGTYAGTRFGGSLTILVRDRDGGWTEDGKDVTEAIEQFSPFYRVEVVGPASPRTTNELAQDIRGWIGAGSIESSFSPKIHDLAQHLLERGWRR